MSNTMTNVEMEDVLASIRRLVSEEDAKETLAEPIGETLLMLTPAQRVPDAGHDQGTSEGGQDFGPPDVATDPSPPPELTEILTVAAAAAKGVDYSGETETPAPSPEFDAMEKSWKAELARVAEARLNAAPDQLADLADRRESVSLENQIADLEAAVGQATEEWEPDGSEPEAQQPLRRHIFEVVSNKPDDEIADVGSDPEAGASAPMFSHATANRPRPYLLSESASLVSSDDPSETVTPTDISEVVKEPVELVENDDVFLDVQALRSMITNVVREELHGRLGETITRNVRRMIQQEITRAIADQMSDENL